MTVSQNTASDTSGEAVRLERTGAPLPLLDATSAALLQSQYDNMLSCIRCGLCLSVCPTYQISFAEEEGPRGRIAMARAVAEGHLPLTPDLVEHSQTCLLCDACTAICPAGVRMEPLGTMMREVFLRDRPHGLRERLLRWLVFRQLFADMRRFRRACRLGWLYQKSGARSLVRRSGLLKLLGLTQVERLLPALPRRFLVPRGQRWRVRGVTPGRTAALFAGCIMSTAYAETDRATARMLARSGAEVVAVAGQGCCGALHVHNGEAAGARALARRNIDAFEQLPGSAIVVNAAGCGSTLKGYGHLLHDDPAYAARAEAFARRVRDVNEELLSAGLPKPDRMLDIRVTLQEPCHLAHAQRIREAPRTLLRALPGVTLAEMNEPALCCGSAGVYNVLHRDRADTLQARKVENIVASGAPVVITSNPGCQLQLEAGLAKAGAAVQVRHIVDLLDEAYGGDAAGDVVEEPGR
ncbi:MAG TPA: (Fe-S)-binding protein [Dehalococcoidia bacterium]|nr:(Fe-S)-binding protein [Dehalococcoidia bacterium]